MGWSADAIFKPDVTSPDFDAAYLLGIDYTIDINYSSIIN